MKLICQNKRAYHDYTVLEKIQAGIALTGTEVKSCRAGSMSLAQSYVHFEPRAAKLVNANIATYAMGSYNNHVPTRQRQLLLHKVEIRRLKPSRPRASPSSRCRPISTTRGTSSSTSASAEARMSPTSARTSRRRSTAAKPTGS